MRVDPAIPVLILVLGLAMLSFYPPLTTDSWWSDSSDSDVVIEVSPNGSLNFSVVMNPDVELVKEGDFLKYTLVSKTFVSVSGACTMTVEGEGYTIVGITLSEGSCSFTDGGTFTITPGSGGVVLSFSQ